MDNAVALAAIALATSTVTILGFVVRFILTKFVKALNEHTKAAVSQKQSSDEVLKFMKGLNGKLEGALIAKVKEKSK